VNDVNVDELEPLPTAFRRRKTAVAVRREGDPAAVRRPRRPEITTSPCGQRPLLTSCEVQDPEIRKTLGPRRDEDNLSTIGRECGLIVVGRAGGQPFDVAAVRMHAKEIGGAGPLRGEGNPISFGRPRGTVIEGVRLRERPLRGAIGVRDKQSGCGWTDAGEDNAIGRKAGYRRASEGKDAKKSREKTRQRAAPESGFFAGGERA